MTIKLNAEQLKRIDENRAKLITARMLRKKYEDSADKIRALLDAANNAAAAADQALKDNLLETVTDAELEKARTAAKKAAEDLDFAKGLTDQLWHLTRAHDEDEIQTDIKHAREALCNQMFDAWLIEFKKDEKLLERLAAGFELYGNAIFEYNRVGWRGFLEECFGFESNERLAEPARMALIAKHKFLQD